MKRYESYKPSGVEWIGEVPKGWKVKRLKHVAKFINGFAFDSQDFKQESDIPVIRIGDIVDGGINLSNALFVKKDSSLNQFEIKKDDILLAMSGATVGKIGIVDNEEGYINQRVGIIRYNNAKFMYYLLSDQKFMTYVLLTSLGSAQPNISTESINNYPCIFPPLPEQTAIADYLDAKCAKIDNVVAVQQKRIELLKELKQSIITKAVTKGLDKNAKMKESGIEWIGEVPNGWKVMKLKRVLASYQDGTHGTYARTPSDFPLLSAKNVFEEGIIISTDESTISESDYKSIISNGFPKKGDVAICCVGTIGRCCLYTLETPQAFQRSVTFLRVNNKILNSYLVYVMRSDIANPQYTMFAKTSAQSGIYMEALVNFSIVVPPFSEQTAIAAYLDKKCAAIDRQIAKIDKQIELLKEYKQSVITECVTGKRKVC